VQAPEGEEEACDGVRKAGIRGFGLQEFDPAETAGVSAAAGAAQHRRREVDADVASVRRHGAQGRAGAAGAVDERAAGRDLAGGLHQRVVGPRVPTPEEPADLRTQPWPLHIGAVGDAERRGVVSLRLTW